MLSQIMDQYQAVQGRLHGMPSRLVVPDTNVYLHHDKRFDEANWQALIQPGPHNICLLVPIAVVREIDRKKTAARNVTVGDTGEMQRTRARTTIRELRTLITDPSRSATLAPGVEIELLLDPLEHHPLADTDAEIIERTLAAKRITGRDISIMTGDGGMTFSAQVEGLSVIPL